MMTAVMVAGVVWRGVLLGLAAAAPIGPVNVEIARRSVRGGFCAGFLLGCGAVTVDVAYAVLTSLGLRPLLGWPRLMLALGAAGVLVLAWLGVMCFASAVRLWRGGAETGNAAQSTARPYVTGVLMTSLNPMTLAFWLVVVPGWASQWSHDPVRDLPLVCVGVFLGAISWVIVFAGLMSWLGRRGKCAMWLAADLAGGLMLLGFAVVTAERLVRSVWR